jgi:hypothetical protein
MLQAVEGIYRNGKIELTEAPQGVVESRVIVTFLGVESSVSVGHMIHFGMFPGSNLSTEADFQSAEFYGDAEDGLA